MRLLKEKSNNMMRVFMISFIFLLGLSSIAVGQSTEGRLAVPKIAEKVNVKAEKMFQDPNKRAKRLKQLEKLKIEAETMANTDGQVSKSELVIIENYERRLEELRDQR